MNVETPSFCRAALLLPHNYLSSTGLCAGKHPCTDDPGHQEAQETLQPMNI